MGRKKGSKNKVVRGKPRTAWETYNYWYDKYTKGSKIGWFRDRLTKDEFEQQYINAKRAGYKTNIARTIAQSQEYVDRSFEKKYKELYGTDLPDIRNKRDREKLFTDFMSELGLSWDEARDEFEKYFY